MAPSIVIDPGHGGYDSGAQFEGRKEKDDVLRLALAVGELLKERGYTVYYTRTTDTYDSPLEKARIANETNGDYFISFHRNSSPRPNTYQGVESLVYEENEVVNAIANGINRQLEQVGFENLGIEERPGLVVLRRTKMPAVLVEAGFINTREDNELFDEKFDEIVTAIADGIQAGVPSPEMPEQAYGVQIGLFRYPDNARFLAERYEDLGYHVQIREEPPYYGVVVGKVSTLEEARDLQRRLREMGNDTLIVQL